MKRSEKILNRIVLIVGAACIAYYLALGLAVRFGQSLQFLWLLAGAVCIGRYLYWKRAERRGKFPRRGPVIALRALFCAALAFFLAAQGMILADGLAPAPKDLDVIIVLGAKVNSGALRNRVQVAEEYLAANPSTVAVLSGGQGDDEEMSEARYMYDRLVAAGVEPSRLTLEDRSADTRQNLRFSREYIPDGASVGLVSNNFHIFRALRLAREAGYQNVCGVPVATSLLSLPHYLMREFCGVAYELVRGNMAL